MVIALGRCRTFISYYLFGFSACYPVDINLGGHDLSVAEALSSMSKQHSTKVARGGSKKYVLDVLKVAFHIDLTRARF